MGAVLQIVKVYDLRMFAETVYALTIALIKWTTSMFCGIKVQSNRKFVGLYLYFVLCLSWLLGFDIAKHTGGGAYYAVCVLSIVGVYRWFQGSLHCKKETFKRETTSCTETTFVNVWRPEKRESRGDHASPPPQVQCESLQERSELNPPAAVSNAVCCYTNENGNWVIVSLELHILPSTPEHDQSEYAVIDVQESAKTDIITSTPIAPDTTYLRTPLSVKLHTLYPFSQTPLTNMCIYRWQIVRNRFIPKQTLSSSAQQSRGGPPIRAQVHQVGHIGLRERVAVISRRTSQAVELPKNQFHPYFSAVLKDGSGLDIPIPRKTPACVFSCVLGTTLRVDIRGASLARSRKNQLRFRRKPVPPSGRLTGHLGLGFGRDTCFPNASKTASRENKNLNNIKYNITALPYLDCHDAKGKHKAEATENCYEVSSGLEKLDPQYPICLSSHTNVDVGATKSSGLFYIGLSESVIREKVEKYFDSCTNEGHIVGRLGYVIEPEKTAHHKDGPFRASFPKDFLRYSRNFVPAGRILHTYPAHGGTVLPRTTDRSAPPTGDKNSSEAVRLASFRNWPEWAQVPATRLARAGFFYSGQADEVICYSCGGHLKQLTKEVSPAELHRHFFPDCRHVRGLDSNNKPLFETEDANTSRNGATGAGFDPFPNLAGEGPAMAPTVSRESNLLLSSQQALTRSLGFSLSNSTTQMSTSSLYHSQQAGNSGSACNQASLQSEISTCIGESERMKSEEERLKTFAHWPIAAHVRPRDLASAGFFYSGNGDSVTCAFCAGILRNWGPGDQPTQEHRRQFPTCPLVLGTVVGNGNHNASRSGAPPSAAGSGSGGSSEPHGGAPIFHGQDLGILTDRPKHERFAIESVREKTFATWSAHRAQNPVNLAKAGFFYAGFSDNVKCFYCDGGLRNWEPQDDPWTEHARWFPRCGFVRQCKGEEFIRHVQELYPRQSTDTPPQLTSQNQAAITNVRRREAGQYVVEAREIKARLDTPTVQAVLEMGYPRDTVRKVIENRLRTAGDDFPNAESLFEAILSYEERQTPGEAREQTPPGETREQTPPGVAEPTQDTPSPSRTSKPAKEEKKRGKKKQKSTEAKTTVGENDEEAKSLIEENQRLKEQRTCKICMDDEVSVVFLPCGHLVSCAQCAPALRSCPICRATIRGTVRTYIA